MLPPNFIRPCLPTPRKEPPAGGGWLHEIKFDGFRVQVHKHGRDVALFSRGGTEWSDRYPAITEAIAKLPTRAVILDAELTACNPDGWTNFSALLRKRHGHLCIWVFDILAQNGKDLRELPLASRRQKLDALMARVRSDVIRYSEPFPDPLRLLAACAEHKLEGIVSKRLHRPYRSGPSSSWIKVKCPEWRLANQWRHEFFARNSARPERG
jgi:bifunctional non-homologous end joining protein LigD